MAATAKTVRRYKTTLADDDQGNTVVMLWRYDDTLVKDSAGRRLWQHSQAGEHNRELVAELTLHEAGDVLRALASDLSYVAAESEARCSRCNEVGSFGTLEANSGVCERCMSAANA